MPLLTLVSTLLFPGSPKVIDCEADIYSSGNEVFWLSGESIVDKNDSLPVFYNYSRWSLEADVLLQLSLVQMLLMNTLQTHKITSFFIFLDYVLSSGNETEHLKMTASLVFKKVSKEDLSKNYTCILETDNGQPSSYVTITLAQRRT